jgi:hypothetical protein
MIKIPLTMLLIMMTASVIAIAAVYKNNGVK